MDTSKRAGPLYLFAKTSQLKISVELSLNVNGWKMEEDQCQ